MKKCRHLLRKLLLIILAVSAAAGGWIAFRGWQRYEEAVQAEPFAAMVSGIQNSETYVSVSELPSIYINAVLSVEDRRFEEHSGIDLYGIARALWTDITTLSLKEGGSTITQQLMKNEYFDQNKDPERKAAEIFAALAFEKEYNKDTILSLYVSTIYFGSGYYGIRAASLGYFGKEPSDLSDAEAVLLAGLPQAPSVYDPTVNPDLALQRMDQVLEKMIRNDCLSEDEAEKLRTEAESLLFFCLCAQAADAKKVPAVQELSVQYDICLPALSGSWKAAVWNSAGSASIPPWRTSPGS